MWPLGTRNVTLHSSVLLRVPNSSDQSMQLLFRLTRIPSCPAWQGFRTILAKGWVVGEKSGAGPPAAVAQSVRLADLGSAFATSQTMEWPSVLSVPGLFFHHSISKTGSISSTAPNQLLCKCHVFEESYISTKLATFATAGLPILWTHTNN